MKNVYFKFLVGKSFLFFREKTNKYYDVSPKTFVFPTLVHGFEKEAGDMETISGVESE